MLGSEFGCFFSLGSVFLAVRLKCPVVPGMIRVHPTHWLPGVDLNEHEVRLFPYAL
jgi:hypothetical protein